MKQWSTFWVERFRSYLSLNIFIDQNHKILGEFCKNLVQMICSNPQQPMTYIAHWNLTKELVAVDCNKCTTFTTA